MIRFNAISEERGDCTRTYEVIMDNAYTVREFIHDVIHSHSEMCKHGCIGIYNPNTDDLSVELFGEPTIEYRNGEVIGAFPEEILDATVHYAVANGGWTLMDFQLDIGE